MIARTLDWLRIELEEAYGLTEYVLFGSTVLYLHGLRDPDTVSDVDVFVSRRVWNYFERKFDPDPPRHPWTPRTPRRGDPPFLASDTAPSVSAFYDWTLRDSWMSVKRCFDERERVQGWNCIPLEIVRHHKRNAGRQESPNVRAKHEADLHVLDYVLA